jgi:uncharacterized protein DUF4410
MERENRVFRAMMVMVSACLAASLLVGCAKATITPQETASSVGTVQRPSKIVVHDFEVSAADVIQNQGPLQRVYRSVSKSDQQMEADRLATGREAAHDLSEDLVKQLKALGFDAENLPPEATPGDNNLVIEGQFLNADEGNRARRMIIGFGAGASHLETLVTVSQASTEGPATELLRFKTYSDSGKMPGAALTMGAGAAAQGAAATSAVTAVTSAGKVYSSMLSTLADKTSKQITAYLSQYFASQGWIAADQVPTTSVTE